MTEEVAARGYAATTVQHVISRAWVPRSAFYDQFTNKQDAFACAHLEVLGDAENHHQRGVHDADDDPTEPDGRIG